MWTTKKLVRNCPAPAPGSLQAALPGSAVGPLPVLLLLLLCSGSLRQPKCQIDTTHFCWLLLTL